MLKFMSLDPIYRKYHHNSLTFSILYAFSEKFVLPFSHDEVVHGKGSMLMKMPGDAWSKFANLRLLYAYMFAHPGKKLLFQGADFGQINEWNHDQSLDWHLTERAGNNEMLHFTRDLIHFYKSNPSFYEVDFSYKGFEWIDFNDWESSIVSFMRKDATERKITVCAFNFTPVLRRNYRIGVPYAGFYQEVFNSDSAKYGGTNTGNLGGVWAEPWPLHNKAHSIGLSLPPYGAVYFNFELPEPEPPSLEEVPSKMHDTKDSDAEAACDLIEQSLPEGKKSKKVIARKKEEKAKQNEEKALDAAKKESSKLRKINDGGKI